MNFNFADDVTLHKEQVKLNWLNPRLNKEVSPLIHMELVPDFGIIPVTFPRLTHRSKHGASVEEKFVNMLIKYAHSIMSVDHKHAGVICPMSHDSLNSLGINWRTLNKLLKTRGFAVWKGQEGARSVLVLTNNRLSHMGDIVAECKYFLVSDDSEHFVPSMSNSDCTASKCREIAVRAELENTQEACEILKNQGSGEVISITHKPELAHINLHIPHVTIEGEEVKALRLKYSQTSFEGVGGRIYNAIQSEKKERRSTITIDGVKACEVDIKCSHLNIAYVLATGKPLAVDAYDLPTLKAPKEPLTRKVLKRAVNTFLNAKSWTAIEGTLNGFRLERLVEVMSELGLSSKDETGAIVWSPSYAKKSRAVSELEHAHAVLSGDRRGSAAEALQIFKKNISRVAADHPMFNDWLFNVTAREIKDAILATHAPVAHFFGTGFGLKAMGLEGESQIRLAIRCIDAGLSLPLSVHDSIVVRDDQADQVIELWQGIWTELIGSELPMEFKTERAKRSYKEVATAVASGSHGSDHTISNSPPLNLGGGESNESKEIFVVRDSHWKLDLLRHELPPEEQILYPQVSAEAAKPPESQDAVSIQLGWWRDAPSRIKRQYGLGRSADLRRARDSRHAREGPPQPAFAN